ncbi:PREDICTED: RNA polymerase II subunit A C-terminal domain phosphatase-like [Acropora digitifera]|uniref:RNA polymerase II subunit A C-terminal domain phosphatase-like n=1 Tax=Acropora digitifera TaxID=70779 RepID=UPI00077A01A0|nr:PREDICTED: RNA polymerase II subunit A C-terminal domain phosphatase-like [Acropora digitifera]
MADRRAREVVISTSYSAKLLRWRVCAGSEVREGSVLCFYEVTDKGEKPGSFITQPKLKSAFAGKVRKLLVAEGDVVAVGKPVMLIDEATECEHRMVMKDLCCDCGVDLRKLHDDKDEPSMPTLASVRLIHNIPELKVCQEEAEALGKKDEKRLLETRKLSLVVDLDQTLIHTTMELIPENMKDVHHFQLPGYPVWYHTKIRPGALEFLSRVSTLYELHIFTMGSRVYAHTIARLLDPEGKLFAYRIRSRDECFNAFSKSPDLRSLFPCGDGMVCIIDDREDVWNSAQNLIHVKPYQYFKGVGDINAPPGSTVTPPNHENTTKEHEIYQQEKEEIKLKEEGGAVIEENNKLDEMRTEEFCEKKRSVENLVPNVEANVKKQEPVADTKTRRVEVSETEGTHETNEDSPRVLENGGDNVTIDNEKEKNEVVEIKECGEDKPNCERNKNGKTEISKAKNSLESNNEVTREESRVPSCEKGEISLVKSQNHNYEFGDDDDDYLLHLEDILHRIHVVFYETVDNIKSATNVDEVKNNPKITKYCSPGTTIPDTKLIITELRREVLRGVNIVFTGVIPTSVRQEESYPCRVACALGAKVSNSISTSKDTDDRSRVTTHVIAGKLGTEKSLRAVQSQGMKIVNPNWLYCCNERWEWVDERLFYVEGLERYKQQIRDQKTPCGTPRDGKSECAHESEGAETKTRTDSVSSADMLMSTLNPLLSFSPTEVEAMDKEVEDLMNASEGESDLIGSVSDSSSSSDSDDSEITDNRKRKHEKDDSNGSPSKKIKVVIEVEENKDDDDEEEVGGDASNTDSDDNDSSRSTPSDGDDDDMAAMLEAELALS